mmetsp:Transcript_37364/g.119865  ORF Transcript_37364/g.119865 Transcript_37364/m.119865 type:complete len:227 (+) Transcript_37364:126-806(+)|eukprot:CAMPEP_0118896716 /NCGR_PEP_ID=MMETSP1166-20130328/4447_1 /TAXON_ID=1104430 /ORGANISM="Chrysoreinhardia sp, Strain CCMP3193" /LENGTH=226 /DNA_ID=CAMNT_0006835775 /DNA_START=73 /DNA_END=753 /DNA_ORIENTATION=+
MTILYSLISRGKTVLAEFTFTSGNFPTITRLLLGKIQTDRDVKMSYVYDQYIFHYICSDHILYLCMCDDPQSTKRRIPFNFLEDVRQRFVNMYGDASRTAIAFAMNAEFAPILQNQMELFNNPAADQFAQVHQKLDDVKNVMVQNIEMVLERGEKLELLVDKTDRLNATAFTFEKSSRKLKEAMFWKKVKVYLILFLVISFVVFVITWAACGADFSKCSAEDDDGK